MLGNAGGRSASSAELQDARTTWLRASGRRPWKPRLAARAKWLPMLGEWDELGADLAFASHEHCGRRHAATACRETRQPLHVAASCPEPGAAIGCFVAASQGVARKSHKKGGKLMLSALG